MRMDFLEMTDSLLHGVFQASQDPGICEACAMPAAWLTFVLESLEFALIQLAVKVTFR